MQTSWKLGSSKKKKKKRKLRAYVVFVIIALKMMKPFVTFVSRHAACMVMQYKLSSDSERQNADILTNQ